MGKSLESCFSDSRCSYDPVSVSVCLSVSSRCSIERDERMNLVFGMDASFDQSYAVI